MDTIREKQNMIEPDMVMKKPADEDSFSHKVFALYPLIGDYPMTEEVFQKLFDNAKKAIDINIRCKEEKIPQKKFKLSVHEQIALVVVQLAKQWNSNEEGRFTRYVAMQFGYRDDSGKVWGLITQSLELAFCQNGKYFIRHNGDREFYETVMAHSFGPVRSWYPLFDLVFSFYTENLDWSYVPGDPLFARLVKTLQKKFNNDALQDEEYLIASKSYNLKVGVRRIVQERPEYCAKLFEDIVKRMHLLVSNRSTKSRRYSSDLIDNWFAEKISNTKGITEHEGKSSGDSSEVALDYRSIYPKYILSNDNLFLQIPSIRIISEYSGSAVASVYVDDSLVEKAELQIRGNELGETIKQKRIEIKKNFFPSSDIHLRLTIALGDDIIYDSDRKLWRQVVVFSDGKEIALNKLRRESYALFAVDQTRISGRNIDVQDYQGTGISRISFHKDYCLLYNGNTLAIDTTEIKDIRIVPPAIVPGAVYDCNGTEYSILQNGSSLKVYIGSENDLKRYHVKIGEIVTPLSSHYDKASGNRAIIPFDESVPAVFEISILDLEKNNSVFQEYYCAIGDFSYSFDKKIYLPFDDESKREVLVTMNGQSFPLTIPQEQDDVCFEYETGTISIRIPRMDYSFENINSLIYGRYIIASELSQTSLLRIKNTTDYPYEVIVDHVEYASPSYLFFKDMLQGADSHQCKPIDIIISVAGKTMVACTAVFEDTFVAPPNLFFKDSALFWDGGASFIGERNRQLILQLEKNGSVCYSFPLTFDQGMIASFDGTDFDDDYYHWSILSENSREVLADAYAFIGNECKVRFANSILSIDTVTEDTDSSAASLKIKPVYIDHIKYVDTMYVGSEDEIFDVYTGRLYWVDYLGEKRFYSFKYNDEKARYMVNPVKIIYINDKYLRIVNQDDEGIYCYYNSTSHTPGYEITDRNPPKGAKNYKDILFYIFSVEQKDKKKVEVAKESPTESQHTQVMAAVEASETVETGKKEDIKLASTHPHPVNDSLKNMKSVLQTEVIEAPVEARILVNAGPGTGKTWTLIEKLIYMVETLEIDPESIQVLCFSRAAVEVIKNRIREAIQCGRANININYVDVRSFDSYASQFLYWVKESDYAAISNSFNIEALNYEERIDLFIDVLNKNPELISQCSHLVVDEVQDLVLSRANMVLSMISTLPEECGITLLGDACQSIYDYQVEPGGVGSEQFYAVIESMNQFEFYAFEKNYRQESYLQNYSELYRKSILEADVDGCNLFLKKMLDEIPDYDTVSIKRFDEDSLNRLLADGNIGIMTRSNAQALMISSIFRRKGIAHTVKRRLEENCFNGWIGVVFNNPVYSSFDRDDFTSEIKNSQDISSFSDEEIEEMWDALSDSGKRTTGRISCRDLLLSIRNYGRNKGLYVSEKQTPVTISTIHRSKGREYDSVIVLDSLLSANPEEMEEQRVNYVAISRAKKHIYKVELDNAYFKTLDNRRCYSSGFGGTGNLFLSRFEVGKENDFDRSSFASLPGVQTTIRQLGNKLLHQEVILEKSAESGSTTVYYNLILRSSGKVIARTSEDFFFDLQRAIKEIKKLPWRATVYEYLFPKRFTGLYISDIASEIGMAKGNEIDVLEHGEIVAWNTLLIEGYAKAEY